MSRPDEGFSPNDVQGCLEASMAAERAGDWESAIHLYRAGLDRWPDDPQLLAGLGKALRIRGRYREAVALLQPALQNHPEDRQILVELGVSLREESRLDEAIALHERLVQLYPGFLGGKLVLAVDQVLRGHPHLALPVLQRLVEERPDLNPFRIGLARALNAMGRYTEALAELEAVFQRTPGSMDGLLLYAEANQKLVRGEAWLEAVMKMRQIAPEAAAVQIWEHDVCLLQGQLEEALYHLHRAVAVHPRYVAAHIAMGSLYWKMDRLDEAQRWLEAAVEIAPWHGRAQGMFAQFQAETGRGTPDLARLEQEALAHPYSGLPYLLGRLYFATREDSGKAVQFLKVAADHALEDIATLRLLGDVHISRGEYGEAVRVLERATSLSPRAGNAWLSLGYARLQLDQSEAALPSLEAAVRLMPQHPQAHQSYGVALTEVGRLPEAITHLTRASHLAPDDPGIAYSLALALEKIGDRAAALRYALAARDASPDEADFKALVERLQPPP